MTKFRPSLDSRLKKEGGDVMYASSVKASWVIKLITNR